MSDTPRGPRSRRPGLPALGLAILIAILGGLFGAPGQAFAHASLSDSNPAANSSGPAPSVITLKFTKAFAVVSPGIQLLDGSGTPVPSSLKVDGVTATLTPNAALKPGTYGVKWAVKAPDSHPRSGAFTFGVVGAGSEPLAAGTNLTRALRNPSTTPYSAVATFGRIVLFASILLAIGAIALAYVVARASGREAAWLLLTARRSSLLIAIGSFVALLADAGLHAGPGIPWPWRVGAWFDTIGTAAGFSYLLILGAAAVILRAPRPRFVATDTWMKVPVGAGSAPGPDIEPSPHPYVAGRLDVRGGKWLFAAIALLTIGLAINGHSQSSSPLLIAWAADIVHVLAVGVWGGGLVLLLAIIARRSRASVPGLVTDAVLRFSLLATIASITAGVSGVLLTVVELPSLGALFTTTFGRILLVKVLVVIAIAAAGAYHHFVLLPRLQADPGIERASATWKTLRFEAVGFAVVVVLSAFLVGASL